MAHHSHFHVNCIVPSSVLESLLAHKSKAVRTSALETLLQSERTRERRSVLGRMMLPGGGLNRTVYDGGNGWTLPGSVVRREDDSAAADETVNEAYDGLGTTYDFFKTELDRDSLDDNGMRLDATVHHGQDYLNAFWNGSQMVFGDGDGEIFLSFTRSLDVIAHELTHGVTEFTAGLTYHNQPGALNESFSDVFGSLVKQYFLQQTADEASWLIGDDIVGPEFPGKALRSMKKPGSAFQGDTQPGHMDDYVHLPDTSAGDWGGVHVNSGIPNKAFQLVSTELGGHAWDVAGRIWYDTLLSLHPTSSFEACAVRSVEIAGGYGTAEQQVVRDAWAELGIKVGQLRKTGRRSRATTSPDAENLKRELKRLSKALERTIEAL